VREYVDFFKRAYEVFNGQFYAFFALMDRIRGYCIFNLKSIQHIWYNLIALSLRFGGFLHTIMYD
jgi:hypothetical protein